MNRIIKFRAWNTKAKEYETGWCYPTTFSGSTFTVGAPEGIVLMQFTGLLDRNGKEIYEGDIVSDGATVNENGVIKWYPENCCFGINGYMQITHGMTQRLEIIGNIFENPELTLP